MGNYLNVNPVEVLKSHRPEYRQHYNEPLVFFRMEQAFLQPKAQCVGDASREYAGEEEYVRATLRRNPCTAMYLRLCARGGSESLNLDDKEENIWNILDQKTSRIEQHEKKWKEQHEKERKNRIPLLAEGGFE